MFAKNVGSIDRIARIVLGIALIAGFYLNDGDSAWRYLYWIGLVPLITGLFSTCPLYSVVGMNTCKKA
ncbi:hypothetical protein Ga0609869_003560 [Rhodovulum iodosum]|uniref:Inner membrane protein YgaP-like transmembrane domain-containing protein n=1 Tax=Rhodovulum iodosum TaxID=68291 RepID=A0ABV3XXW4_9RHOB|nr:DUF2892 domain-containing protein [Rhodovulum robiginosum]RSK38179.1 DUF2892 domain-containing protein [Rhodovulum robiginosum]